VVIQNRLFQFMACVLLVANCFAAGEDNSTITSTSSNKEWSILVYGVPIDAARYALKNIDDAMSGASDEATNILWCSNLWNSYASLWQVSSHALVQLDPLLEPETHLARITRLMNMLSEQYPAKKYALIMQGGGAGFIDHMWDPLTKSWSAHSGVRRGALCNDQNGSFISPADMVSAVVAVSSNLGKKLDVLIADAGNMTSLEFVTAVSDSVEVYMAPASEQYVSGFRYEPLFEAFGSFSTSAEIGIAGVQSSGAFYNTLVPGGSQCFVAIECGLVASAWDAFTNFMTQFNALLQTNTSLATSIYKIRSSVGVAGLECCYVDAAQWLEQVQQVLEAQSDNNGALTLGATIPALKAQLSALCLARSAGAGAAAVGGVLLCYPTTVPTIFAINQAGPWNQFVNASLRGALYV